MATLTQEKEVDSVSHKGTVLEQPERLETEISIQLTILLIWLFYNTQNIVLLFAWEHNNWNIKTSWTEYCFAKENKEKHERKYTVCTFWQVVMEGGWA